MPNAAQDVIVIGGSAGSTAVLKKLLEHLPPDLPASICISTHVPAHAPGLLAEMLDAAATLPVSRAIDRQPLERGRIYVAPPDRHLLLLEGGIVLGTGPRENMSRPAIDPLFRSAALTFGSRVIGVILSGMLNDGASGLLAVKQRGGLAVVQHPLDAEAPDMPLAALEAVDADHIVRADQLAKLLTALAGSKAGAQSTVSDTLRLEVEIAAGRRLGSERLMALADPVPLSCPDCDGVLSEMRDARPLRFRCQIGHSYTADILAARDEQVDAAVRVAMRIMEERVTLVERMARDARDTGRTAVAELYEARAEEYGRYAATLREAATLSLRTPPPHDT